MEIKRVDENEFRRAGHYMAKHTGRMSGRIINPECHHSLDQTYGQTYGPYKMYGPYVGPYILVGTDFMIYIGDPRSFYFIPISLLFSLELSPLFNHKKPREIYDQIHQTHKIRCMKLIKVHLSQEIPREVS